MLRLSRSHVVMSSVALAASFALVACGEDEKKKDDEAVGWKAEVVKVEGGKAEVGFDGAAVDEKYVLMPLSVGSPATVEGGSDETFTFKLSTTAAGGSLHGVAPGKARQPMSLMEYHQGKRTLLNRFDPKKGEDQGQWFWDLAKQLDEGDPDAELRESVGPGAIESGFRSMAKSGAIVRERLNLTTAGDCPAAGGKVVMPDIYTPTDPYEESVPTGGAVSAADYCIVYLSDPVTGGTKDEIEASIKEIMSRYKTVIYNDEFAAAGDYTFKPVFVVVDFDSAADLWPAAENFQAAAGVFLGYLSTEAKMPMLYMSADLSKIAKFKAKNLDAAKSKALWHGTLAHEVQHAIINYFRVRKGGGEDDVPAIDEGLAHYMEDLFGYGSENFSDYVGAYMQNWNVNNPPIHATDSGDVTRGGAQSFLYYLTSQKGGVEFANGVVSGGAGLDLIVEAVKSSGGKRGPANLSAKFGGDWLETVANFYGALLLDGTADADKTLEVQAPATINDLTGGTDKKFGMRFNGFVADFDASKAVTETTADVTELEMTYYGTSPVIYTVKDPAAKVTFTTTQDAANTAVVKVRIK